MKLKMDLIDCSKIDLQISSSVLFDGNLVNLQIVLDLFNNGNLIHDRRAMKKFFANQRPATSMINYKYIYSNII